MSNVADAIKRIEFNLKQLPSLVHSPDVARQLSEDWDTVKANAHFPAEQPDSAPEPEPEE